MSRGHDAAAAVTRLKATARAIPGDAGLGAGLVDLAVALEGAAPADPPGPGGDADPVPGPSWLDVNAADAAASMRLPLMGPWAAARLVEARTGSAGFATVEAVRDLLGLDAWAWRMLAPHLTLGAALPNLGNPGVRDPRVAGSGGRPSDP